MTEERHAVTGQFGAYHDKNTMLHLTGSPLRCRVGPRPSSEFLGGNHTDAYHVGFRVVRPLKLPDESVAASFEITPEDALRFRERYGETHFPLRELEDLPEEEREPRCLYTDIRPSENGE